MKKYKRVILGATVFSAGFSLNLTEDDIIIEKNIFTGAEFCQSLKANPIDIDTDYCEKTKEFLKQLKERNILGDDGAYSAIALSPVISSYFLKSKATVLLDCVVTKIDRNENGFIIEYFGESGFCEITVDEIIDTTDTGIFDEAVSYPFEYQVGVKRSYIANLDGYNGKTGDFEVIKGHLNNEYYLKINAEDLSLIEARAALTRIAEKNNFKIAAFASLNAFDYKTVYKTVRMRNYYFVPSASFRNFADAFDNGVKGAFKVGS